MPKKNDSNVLAEALAWLAQTTGAENRAIGIRTSGDKSCTVKLYLNAICVSEEEGVSLASLRQAAEVVTPYLAQEDK